MRRCDNGNVPRPSIIINSGNGIHVYWLLDQPYLIDDAKDPPPVNIDWIEQGEGEKKRPRKWIIDEQTGEKVYLDHKRDEPKLSSKAQLVQDVLEGVAAAIGGDHTQDLSRLLRIPGTLNRKDERNGWTPIPCAVVELDAGRRYSIVDFARFAEPVKVHREKAATMVLPPTKKLTTTNRRRITDLINASEAVGERSERDFDLCCFAIREGIAQAEVWAMVASVGKFGEEGERYFDRTWANAADDVRKQIYDTVIRKHGGPKGSVNGNGKAAVTAADIDELGAIKTIADTITTDNHFAQDAGHKLYRYQDGVYHARGKEFVRREVKRLLNALRITKKWSSRLADEVCEYIRVDSPLLPDVPPLDVLNVQNGLLRLVRLSALSALIKVQGRQ